METSEYRYITLYLGATAGGKTSLASNNYWLTKFWRENFIKVPNSRGRSNRGKWTLGTGEKDLIGLKLPRSKNGEKQGKICPLKIKDIESTHHYCAAMCQWWREI